MATIAQTPDIAVLDRPAVSEEALLVGTVTVADLRDHSSPAVVLRDDEFVAVLGAPSPGSPNHVIGTRTDGRAYDRIALTYEAGGRAHRRTWSLEADHGAEARYRLLEDTAARGGFAVLVR